MKRNEKTIKTSTYNPRGIEERWNKEWLREKIYSPDIINAKNPFYNLMMFPYPSAEGLHVGNMYAFTGADVYGRYKRMNGFDVFEPIGLDGFGIHSENYAIKVGRHPKDHAEISQKNFYNQLHLIGDSFDWTHTLETYDPDYYRWTQWLFIKMFKAGLAYKDKKLVNWCPNDKTVLADEQVINGSCERCGSTVEKREMNSWFFKITDYADKLLSGIDQIKWPEKIKIAQRNWIGRSDGRLIEFKMENSDKTISVFTTRPDTLNAVTFLATSKLYEEGSKEKKGEFTGDYAISPLDGRKIPVWDTNYVTPNYGTGVVMGVPAHDERDMEFAKKYKIDVLEKDPEDNSVGEKKTLYHLRDWGISRQRYWGPPIPMIYCDNDGWVPVDEEDLPVILPDIKDFKPKGDGTSPLSNAPESWKKVKCPKCGKEAERELDVSDTFLDSAWYFLRYPSTLSARSGQAPFDPDITKKWLPVDAYIGGAEHAVLHLLYARFVWMVLIDNGLLPKELGSEPFPFLYGHGLIIKDGAKMSKSKGNVVNPDEYINKYGADALRTYLMFLGPFDQGGDFRDTGIEGMSRFFGRVWRLFNVDNRSSLLRGPSAASREAAVVNSKENLTIKKVTEDMEAFKFNTAIAKIMELVNVFTEYKVHSTENLGVLARLLAPFAPHLAEEMWVNVLGMPFSIHKASWPSYEAKYIVENEATIVIQINGKMRSQLIIKNLQLTKEEITAMAKNDIKVTKWLKGKDIKKTIFVPGKLVNFVI